MAIMKRTSGYDEDMDGGGGSEREEKVKTPALLPKTVLMGKPAEVGDKLVLRIDKIMEDEIAVSYSTEAESEKEPEQPTETEPESEQGMVEGSEEPVPSAMSGYE